MQDKISTQAVAKIPSMTDNGIPVEFQLAFGSNNAISINKTIVVPRGQDMSKNNFFKVKETIEGVVWNQQMVLKDEMILRIAAMIPKVREEIKKHEE